LISVELKDKVEFTAEELKNIVAKGIRVRTSAPSPMEFVRAAMQLGNDLPILIATLTSKLSGTYNAARAAAKILQSRGYEVRVFDTLSGSIGAGIIVQEALRMADVGMDIDDAIKKLEELRARHRLYLFIADMHAASRSGRVPEVVGRIGKFLRLHPAFHVPDGYIRLWRVFRGENSLITGVQNLLEGVNELWAGVLGESPLFSKVLGTLQEEGIRPPVAQVDPAIGVHLGYGSFGFAFFAPQGQ
jgi:DegV family protein with EDD domain